MILTVLKVWFAWSILAPLVFITGVALLIVLFYILGSLFK